MLLSKQNQLCHILLDSLHHIVGTVTWWSTDIVGTHSQREHIKLNRSINQTVMQRSDVCQCVWQLFSRRTHFHSNSSWASRPETNKKSLASLPSSDQLPPAGKHCRVEYWTCNTYCSIDLIVSIVKRIKNCHSWHKVYVRFSVIYTFDSLIRYWTLMKSLV